MTRKPAAKKAAAKKTVAGALKSVMPRNLAAIIYHGMLNYGKHVIEERAIPDFRDGLKPVQRKSLWAMYKLGLINGKPVKTARVVGEVLGKYHPHGDKSVQDAITKLAQQCTSPVFGGDSNWGSITGDTPAAMRYTNVKLSKYGAMFFDPYYMPAVDLVPNYDGSEEEPVVLPALLPNVLMNGGEGMAVAVTCKLPTYTPQSVIKCLIEAASKGGATPAMCAALLEFNCESNGVVLKGKQKAELGEFYKTGQAGIVFDSRITYSDKEKAFVLTGAAPWKGVDSRMNALLGAPDKIGELKGVDDQSEQWKLNILYPVVRGLAGEALETVKKKLQTVLSSKVHFKVNITERVLVEEGGWRKSKSKFRPSTVPTIINDWLKWRVDLEVRATTYHLEQLAKAMRRNELLRLAVKFREFIFSLAKSTKNDEQVKAAIKAKLKCTQEEAEYIFDMKWRQLRSMEDKVIAAKLAEQTKQRAEWEKRRKNAAAYVVEHLKELAKLF